jgi:hypothetical protein
MGPLPTPERVYEQLVAALEPAFAALDCKRLGALYYPCWITVDAASGEHVFISMQVDEKATDPYAGGGFRMSFEKTTMPVPNHGLKGRAHFFQLLRPDELASILEHQNRIIASLPGPPKSHVALYPAGMIREQYLSYFRPQHAFDAVDSWLRFRTLLDVEMWSRVFRPLLGNLVHRAATYLDPASLHLGRGSLVRL